MAPLTLDPNDLLLFARVAEDRSFTRAADHLGIPKSTLSRRISALEAQLGERLLLRTTRKLSLTELGDAVLAHARQVASEVDATLALGQNRQGEPAGRLRVTMPADLAIDLLAGFLGRFASRYPLITLELDLSARRVDLVAENFDVALRLGELADEASLAARRAATFTMGLYASPAYLKRRGTPAVPQDLREHDGLILQRAGGESGSWRLERDGQLWSGMPRPRILANTPGVLLRLMLADLGIAMLGDHFAFPYLRDGTLVQLLPHWQPPSVPVWAVFPGRRLMPSRTRVFIDAVVEELGSEQCRGAERDILDERRLAQARVEHALAVP